MRNKICEEVWGEDGQYTFDSLSVDIKCDIVSSKYCGLPEYLWVDELEGHYTTIREFSRWLSENLEACDNCKHPWVGALTKSCYCGKRDGNIDRIYSVYVAATAILRYHENYILRLARNMEFNLEGDSEYAKLNRRAKEVLYRCANRINPEFKPSSALTKFKPSSVFVKIKELLLSIARFFKLSYWKTRIISKKIANEISPKISIEIPQEVIRMEGDPIPIEKATYKDIEEMAFGENKNCCVKTKGGAVVIVPSSQVIGLRDNYKGGFVVPPKIKN